MSFVNFHPVISFLIALCLSFQARAYDQNEKSKNPMLTTVVTIVDETGKPVESATIEVNGLRKKIETASHYSWNTGKFGPSPIIDTDSNGKATIPYPKFVEEDLLTGAISFYVKHPNYVKIYNTNYPVVEPKEPIRLQRGAIFKVRGFVEENGSKQIVKNIHPMATAVTRQTANGSSGGWIPQKDGWFETKSLPPGGAIIMLASISESGQALFSQTNTVWLQHQGAIEQELELTPGEHMEGKLDDSVPRPVRNGIVIAYCYPVMPGVTEPFKDALRMFFWRDWTEIREDGTFSLRYLPTGRIELIALCDGYRSKSPEEKRIGWPQTFHLTGNTAQVEITMEQTAVAEIHVKNPDGEPVAGAVVSFWPNVRWNSWMSTIYGSKPLRTKDSILKIKPSEHANKDEKLYTSISDENGIAVVRNLPAGHNTYSVTHEKYAIPAKIIHENFTSRSGLIELEAGKQTTANIDLIEKGTDTLGGGENQ